MRRQRAQVVGHEVQRELVGGQQPALRAWLVLFINIVNLPTALTFCVPIIIFITLPTTAATVVAPSMHRALCVAPVHWTPFMLSLLCVCVRLLLKCWLLWWWLCVRRWLLVLMRVCLGRGGVNCVCVCWL